jgi:hypothetical protein
MMIQPLLQFVGGISAWVFYSQLVKLSVVPTARRTTIISQTRPEGNRTLLKILMNDIVSLQDDDVLLSDYRFHIWGLGSDRRPSARYGHKEEIVVKKLGKNMVLCTNRQRSTIDIYANQELQQNTTLRELVSSTRKQNLVTDPFQFALWMQVLKKRVNLKPSSNISGSYCLAFRDYWNFEEAYGLETRRGSMKLLNLRAQRGRPSLLQVANNGNCTLTDFYVIHGIVPMRIQWEGQLRRDTMVWTRTFIRKGWDLAGTTIDRPPLAEMFRKQPWKIKLPQQDQEGDLLILEREGIGHLVFARDNMFAR